MIADDASRRERTRVAAPAASDRAAHPPFESFFHAEYTRLYAAMCGVTGSRHEAEDITQEAFVRVLERWGAVGTMDDPTGYLYRTAMNIFRSRYRRAKLAMRKAAGRTEQDNAFAAVDTREELIRSLRELSPRQRAAIVLTQLRGYSSEEAAQMLGTNAAAVRMLTSRARTAMRKSAGGEA
ncbi:MAG TPA: sigma-70 family RNA polymerase sigma factor [Actinomycetota bacterium]|nr:sigma-70 family RNA polymerase sigma factor [Actinomycetota bacterium]